MEKILYSTKKYIPSPLFRLGQPIYHWLIAFSSAIFYGFPSRKLKIIGVTGTKGKSSTTEILNAILEEAGYRTAVANTIRFKIGDHSQDNMYKMSMPGRGFIQRFLRRAVQAKCDFVVMEITSQGALQYRNKFIELDAFIFTNLSPEHIESHGSYEKYIQAKVGIAKEIEGSSKLNRAIIINTDDQEAPRFMSIDATYKIPYSLSELEPYTIKNEGLVFTLNGLEINSPLSGIFNLSNILAAIKTAKHFDISDNTIRTALEKFNEIKGRVEKIEMGQDFTVIIDYAHTPDSMEKLYQLFKDRRIIAVFGCTGGGRDTWKRKEMGKIADKYAAEIILTDDDSYDENIFEIFKDIQQGIKTHTPFLSPDRKIAIQKALNIAHKDDVVLITGKGTDPYLMGPKGAKTPWNDAKITRELIAELLQVK